jgi:hypothetical protein
MPVELTIEGSDAIRVGITMPYRAKAAMSTGTLVEVTPTWTSSDPMVATVQANGSAAGNKPGSVRLEASFRGATASKTVEVVDNVDSRWIVSADTRQCEEAGAPVSDWPMCGQVRSFRSRFVTHVSLAHDAADARRISGKFSLGGVASSVLGHCEPWWYGPEIPLTGHLSSDGQFSVEGAGTVGDYGGFLSFPPGTRLTLRGDTRFVAQGEWRGRWGLEISAPSGRSWEFEVSSNTTTRDPCGFLPAFSVPVLR